MKNVKPSNLRIAMLLLASFVSSLFLNLVSADDWSRWRGPNGDGIATGQTPPVRWDQQTNIIWKSKVPGRGHASPLVVGDRIFLATADDDAQTQSVLAYDRSSGESIWNTQVNEGELNPRIHPKNTHASPTIATDGERVFAVFNHHSAVHLVALDFEGNKVWEKKVGEFESRYPFGYGASPIVHDGMVIVTNLNRSSSSGLVSYDGKSGKEQWRTERPQSTSYSTPVVADVAGQQQLLLSGPRKVFAVNPSDGKLLWEAPAKWDVTCGTMVWNEDGLVFASGGYPAQQTLAVKADGSGTVVWDNSVKAYEQSMLYHDGYLYTHADNGGVYCWRGTDGKEMWKARFGQRNPAQSASPVLANGNIYFTAENGETLVIKASPDSFQEVARNQLGDSSFASFAVCGNQIFTRVAFDENGGRQEYLVCIGE